MKNRILGMASAAIALGLAGGAAAVSIKRPNASGGPSLQEFGYSGRLRSNRVKRDRIAAYKRQRAANRQRRKLEAERSW